MSDGVEYWKDHIPSFHTAIVSKIIELGYTESIDLLGVESKDMRYNVFGFIDNTIIKTCRPGGSAAARGPNAPRFHRLVQQAFYTGWKKVHGVKFQTISLPNGMLFHVFGPVSCRRGDRFTLPQSDIEVKLEKLMRNWEVKYHVYGEHRFGNFIPFVEHGVQSFDMRFVQLHLLTEVHHSIITPESEELRLDEFAAPCNSCFSRRILENCKRRRLNEKIGAWGRLTAAAKC